METKLFGQLDDIRKDIASLRKLVEEVIKQMNKEDKDDKTTR